MNRDESNRVYWFQTRFLIMFSLFVGCFYHKGSALSNSCDNFPMNGETDGTSHHGRCTVSNCPLLPITSWHVTLHKNL